MTSSPHPALLVITLTLASLGLAPGQYTQSLPNGWLPTPGTATSFIVNASDDSVWQWHYDSAQFLATGPITITEIWVRASATGSVGAFSFPSLEVTCATALTDYTTASHSTTFAANLSADATVVRTGPWTGGPIPPSGGPTASFIPLGLSAPFVYDPSTGNDFIIQLVKCGTTATWGATMDGASGTAGLNGGNRYGFNGSCTAVTSTFSNNEFVPIVRIDYSTDNLLNISQSGPGVGDLTLALANVSPTALTGIMLISANTLNAVGSGPALGIYPDASTWWVFTSVPSSVGNPFHFPAVAPTGFFPASPFVVGPGTLSSLSGLSVDVVYLMLGVGSGLDSRSNLVRFQFQ